MLRLRHGAFACAAILLALAILPVIDAVERHDIAQQSATDIGLAAARAATLYSHSKDRCDDSLPDSDLSILAKALIAVEKVATSRLERWLEEVVVRSAVAVHVAPPDWSIGPAQIRISTALAAARETDAPATSFATVITHKVPFSVTDLLSACGAQRHAISVIRWIAARNNVGLLQLGRASIIEIASRFNGQVTVPTDEAAIANHIYREFVYQVFQELRFRR